MEMVKILNMKFLNIKEFIVLYQQKVNVLSKVLILLTGEECQNQNLEFNKNEKRRSNIMTMARIQPSLKKLDNFFGYYNGTEIWPQNITESNKALYLYNNHFCLIWKSQEVSFTKAIEELKANFKLVDSFITQENVNFHFNY